MTTPGFLPYPTGFVGLATERNMQDASPTKNGTATKPASVADKPSVASVASAAAAPQSATTQELDNIYERLNNVSLSLKNTDPAHPPKGKAPNSDGSQLAPTNTQKPSEAKASPPPHAADTDSTGHDEPAARSLDECDPDCACHRVLLPASPGSCGICGGRPKALAAMNDDRSRALEDLEIATQRINELAHEKARHVDYIADLETRVAEQAKKMDQQRDIVAGLKNDLSAMNDKFVDQVNMTAEISHSRELVEAELEDLTQKLFTEANTMVAEEKRARAETEKTASHLRKIIADLEERLSNETMQSHELKERIEQMSAEYDELIIKRNFVSSRRGSFSSHLSDMTGGDGSVVLKKEGSILQLSGSAGGNGSALGAAGGPPSDGFRVASHAAAVIVGSKTHSPSPLAAGGSPIRLDETLLAEFKDFATQAQSPRSSTYMSMSYIKSVVSADIEPCLRFGPHPRISSRNVHDAIMANRLQIEEMTSQIAAEMRRQQQNSDRTNGNRHAMLWERFSGSIAVNPNGCQACGRECQQCSYRFRMGYRPDSEWIQIDTMCRDRLVAVCEFYGFVRYLRQGIFASRSLMDLYTETIRLRLCMFYARIGAYGYAIDIDPALTEAPIFPRSPSVATHPDSPTASALAGNSQHPTTTPIQQHASPMTVPYINTGRAASTASVSSIPHHETTTRSSSLLAIDAVSAANRYRSRSHEASSPLNPATQKPAPEPLSESEKSEPQDTATDETVNVETTAVEKPASPQQSEGIQW
ncbi:hypothetical protein IW140_006372 [Coemansia sp. RSA 1813]|nr:hypothetical protein LPJ74_006207 [Coemansia sp. RSA 1843]KAJ2085449.1 hypothetical protein IW138_006323 [Coemansia sp. RSA 986]KAJ2210374.1 hypothetical protein EV179_006289 [Coemansia sp. RSA 487]KAJ2562617.1 hypothetical protein IW140_006372 [Coemansia sp. RSA 1813]